MRLLPADLSTDVSPEGPVIWGGGLPGEPLIWLYYYGVETRTNA
jgi:hypothetical protein